MNQPHTQEEDIEQANSKILTKDELTSISKSINNSILIKREVQALIGQKLNITKKTFQQLHSNLNKLHNTIIKKRRRKRNLTKLA